MNEHALILLAALALDAIFGEPDVIWRRVPHPAVIMGRAVAWGDTHFNRGHGRTIKGTLTILGLAGLAGLFGLAIASLPGGWVLEALAAAVLLAQKSLVQHVRAVADGLRRSLEEGRSAVAMIVGRDTAPLDEAAVARAAIESGAENLSDGVVAPAFWCLIGGLPGILIYKMVNTADSMIGHKTERHGEFGWASARLDDVLNWVPARLTAVFIALACGSAAAFRGAASDGPKHRSLNAGWPEAAMAYGLNLSLSGPRSYGGTKTTDAELNPTGRRAATAPDIDAACGILWRVWGVVFLMTIPIALI